MVLRFCQTASATLLGAKRTEPAANETLTPPGCRLRAVMRLLAPTVQGMSGGTSSGRETFWSSMPQLLNTSMPALGVSSVWNIEAPGPSLKKSPRRSLILGLGLMMGSDINSVFDVPSVIMRKVVCGAGGLPIVKFRKLKGARARGGGFGGDAAAYSRYEPKLMA